MKKRFLKIVIGIVLVGSLGTKQNDKSEFGKEF